MMEKKTNLFDQSDCLSSIRRESDHNITGIEYDSLNFDSVSFPPSSRGHGSMPSFEDANFKIGMDNSKEISKINKMYDMVSSTEKHTFYNLEECMHNPK